MAFIDKRGRLFGRFNILDILIVAVILAAFLGVYVLFFSGGAKGAADTAKLTYDIEVKGVTREYADAITPGDPIRDSVKGSEMGQVVSSTAAGATTINMDTVQGRYVKVNVPELYDVVVRIEADASVTQKDIIVGGTSIKVGKKFYIKGRGYASSNPGYVIGMSLGK